MKRDGIFQRIVNVELVKSKCLPILIYWLECYCLNKTDQRS